MKTKTKIYKVICSDFGHKFSFNAKDEKDADIKLNKWLSYHSFDKNGYSLQETTEEKWIHNEYID